MLKEQRKEDLSVSYISALCTYTGIDFDIIRHDADSTDAMVKKTVLLDDGREYLTSIRVQLKSTSSKSQYVDYEDYEDYVSYRLKVKNYNDLCKPSNTPAILALLILPEDEKTWVKWTTEELLIRGRMYWARFTVGDKSNNSSHVTVRLEKKNILNSETLSELLEKTAKEEW